MSAIAAMVPLHHMCWGAPRSNALLLVHPLGADRRFWDEAAAYLKEDYFCVAPDLRSAGRSPVAGRAVPIEQHVQDLQSLCRSLQIDSVTIIGCAVGAVIAAAFASRASVRVEAAVLSSPTVSFPSAAREMLARRVALAHKKGMAALAPEILERAFTNMPGDERKQTFLAMVSDHTAQGYDDIVKGISDADITRDLQSIACPVLVLASVNDLLLPPDLGRDVARLIPHADFDQIDQGAHFIPFQAAMAFTEKVRTFLSARTVRSD